MAILDHDFSQPDRYNPYSMTCAAFGLQHDIAYQDRSDCIVDCHLVALLRI